MEKWVFLVFLVVREVCLVVGVGGLVGWNWKVGLLDLRLFVFFLAFWLGGIEDSRFCLLGWMNVVLWDFSLGVGDWGKKVHAYGEWYVM